MSIDPDVNSNTATLEPQPQTKTSGDGRKPISSRLRGCGCLVVLFLIGAGSFAFYWLNYEIPLRDFIKSELNLATSSEQLGEIVGKPFETGDSIREILNTLPNSAPKIRVTIPIGGANGKGNLILLGEKKLNEEGKLKWIKESLLLDFDGKKTDLNPEEEMIPDLDIDFGF